MVNHNLVFFDMWENGKVDLVDEDEEDKVEISATIDLTESEEQALYEAAEKSDGPSASSHSTSSTMNLLHADLNAVSREDDITAKLKYHVSKEEVHVDRSAFANPWEDPLYDAKAFPTLCPFGMGGLPRQGHGLSDMELERLHLCRGGDFKHQQSMRYIFGAFIFFCFILFFSQCTSFPHKLSILRPRLIFFRRKIYSSHAKSRRSVFSISIFSLSLSTFKLRDEVSKFTEK